MALRDKIIMALFATAAGTGAMACVEENPGDDGDSWMVGEELENSSSNAMSNSKANNSSNNSMVNNSSTSQNNNTVSPNNVTGNSNNMTTNTSNNTTSTSNNMTTNTTNNTTIPVDPICEGVDYLDVLPNATYPRGSFGSNWDWSKQAPEHGPYLVCSDELAGSCDAYMPGGQLAREYARKHAESALGDQGNGCGVSVITQEFHCGAFVNDEGSCCAVIDLQFSQCAVGRPFVVDGMVRSAQVSEREGWSNQAPLDASLLAELSSQERELLGAAWARMGSYEHASVASFSRFLMQLMALGAPRDLVEQTTAAIQDEIKHAADCFGVASALVGKPLGPMQLEVEGSMPEARGLELARQALLEAIDEGCVGETLAAVQAELESARAVDPHIQKVLAEIAEEEGRHALLGWRFVGWLLQEYPQLRPEAARHFARQLREARQPVVAQGATDAERRWSRWGYSSDALRLQMRLRAIETTVRPCVEALFASLEGVELVERVARSNTASEPGGLA